MQNNILKHAEMAAQGADYTDRAGKVSGRSLSVKQPGKTIIFFWKTIKRI